MKVTLDEHGSMYVYLLDLPVAKTETLHQDRVFIDKSEFGQIVGIEILGVELERQ